MDTLTTKNSSPSDEVNYLIPSLQRDENRIYRRHLEKSEKKLETFFRLSLKKWGTRNHTLRRTEDLSIEI